MSRSPNDKITKTEGELLRYLVRDAATPDDCLWSNIHVSVDVVCDGLVECKLVEEKSSQFEGVDEKRTVRPTVEGWARVQSMKSGQIGYQLGMAAARENVQLEWEDQKESRVVVLDSDASTLMVLSVQRREDDSVQFIEVKIRVYRDDLGSEEAKVLMGDLKPQVDALCKAMGGVIE